MDESGKNHITGSVYLGLPGAVASGLQYAEAKLVKSGFSVASCTGTLLASKGVDTLQTASCEAGFGQASDEKSIGPNPIQLDRQQLPALCCEPLRPELRCSKRAERRALMQEGEHGHIA